MFKFESITINGINGKQRFISFDNAISYIYAPNTRGKSLLCKCIDFMLGADSRDKKENVFNLSGMRNVQSIEAVLTFAQGKLMLMRTVDEQGNIFSYYKTDADSEYLLVNDELYKEKITANLIDGDFNEIERFSEIHNWGMSHRTLGFFNFLDQNSMGNIKYIFSRANLEKHIWQYKDIILYIINHEYCERLVKLNLDLKKCESQLKHDNLKEERLSIHKQLLFDELKKIGINVKDFEDAKNALINFKNNYDRPNLSIKEKDLNFLYIASHSLAEEIKIVDGLCVQSTKIAQRQKQISLLLNIFKEVIAGNDKYLEYTTSINSILSEIKEKKNTFSAIDFVKTKDSLLKEKQKIDQQINILENQLIKLSYIDVEKSITISGDLIALIENIGEIKNTVELKKRIDNLKLQINELKHSFDCADQEIIGDEITSLYESLRDVCYFVDDDYKHDGFKIEFDARKVELYGSIIETIKLSNGKVNKSKTQYNPGSMARQTTWQLLGYLTLMNYSLNHVKGLPLLPMLVLDNISMPYDIEKSANNYKWVYKLVKEYAINHGIQLIVTSNVHASDIDEDNEYDLSCGLNPAYT